VKDSNYELGFGVPFELPPAYSRLYAAYREAGEPLVRWTEYSCEGRLLPPLVAAALIATFDQSVVLTPPETIWLIVRIDEARKGRPGIMILGFTLSSRVLSCPAWSEQSFQAPDLRTSSVEDLALQELYIVGQATSSPHHPHLY
jgi:hypothetical protein